MNTVKRYARMPEPTGLRIASAHRPTLVDPYREHLHRRRTEDPGVPVLHLFHEITELGCTGSLNSLHTYLNQRRADGDRPVTTPRRAARLLLSDPENLRPKEATLPEKITAACPEMTELADLVRGFAALLTPAQGNDPKLTEWITVTRAAALPHLRSFANGRELDAQPPTPASPCPTTTVAPKASTPERNGCCRRQRLRRPRHGGAQ